LPGFSRPIKVVYVINSLGVGGAERMVCDLVRGLDRDQFHAEVTCLYSAGKFSELLDSAGIPVRVLALDRRFLPRNWVKTWLGLRHAGADVIHTHLPESAWYGLPAAYVHRIPVRISHLHSVYLRWSKKARTMDRAVRASASLSVACSSAVRDVARDLGYADAKLTVIPNGVDATRFASLPDQVTARSSLQLPQDCPILISVASLYEHKGHSHLFEAMTRLHQDFPQARLLLVGDKHEARRAALEDTVERLGLQDTVRFLGHREDVPLLLAASDLFVMPSLREGFPMALLEAGAAGLPAVASSVGGIPEIVADDVTGVLVPPEDHAALADAVRTLLREPNRRRSMGDAARRRVTERFALHVTVRQIQDVYLDLLGGTSARTLTRASGAAEREGVSS
jgi:glycosyltransferase involved in cell wall biosynthesis